MISQSLPTSMQYPNIPFPYPEASQHLYPNPSPSPVFHNPLKHIHRHHLNQPYYAAHHAPYAHPYLVKHNNQSPQPQSYPHLPMEPAPTESPVGFSNDTFERSYQVGPVLGKGGFGVVYAGIRISDGRHVALKHVAKAKITDYGQVRLPYLTSVCPIVVHLLGNP